MTTVLRKGCDSYAHATTAVLDALGLDFAWQYLLGSRDKQLTAAVAEGLLNGGKDITLNAENTATDADGGFAQGARYALLANQQADAIGAPHRNADGSLVTIVYSVDSQRSADQVRPYFLGLNSVRNTRTVSGYGGTEIRQMKREGLSRVWGQANAGSWSGWGTSNFPTDPEADFRQHLPTSWHGYNFDPQDQISPSAKCGFWLAPANIVPPHPNVIPPEVPDVLTLVQFEVTVKAAPATRPDVKPGDLAVCFGDGRNFWWVPTSDTLSDATGVVLPELGAKVIPHSPAGPVADPFAFGSAGPANAATAQLLGLAFP